MNISHRKRYITMAENKNYKKIVLAYSGGLDTSIIIPWLKENYPGCEVIAVNGNEHYSALSADKSGKKAFLLFGCQCKAVLAKGKIITFPTDAGQIFYHIFGIIFLHKSEKYCHIYS